MSAILPEEDLSCPVCCEIFQDPVLLPCSHSFCRSCLEHFWGSVFIRSCPVCRRRASRKSPASNRALKNLCEAFLLGRGQGSASGSNILCWRHGEKLKLFCLVDQEPICVVCQASKNAQRSRLLSHGRGGSRLQGRVWQCHIVSTNCVTLCCSLLLIYSGRAQECGLSSSLWHYLSVRPKRSWQVFKQHLLHSPPSSSHCGICVLLYSGKMWSTPSKMWHKSIRVYLRSWIWVTLQREVCVEKERLDL